MSANDDVISPIPAGWVIYSNNLHIYQFFGANIVGADAITAAAALIPGLSYLATVTSSGENSFIDALAGSSWTHIGGDDLATTGTWKWTTGPEAGQTFYVVPTGAAAGAYVNWAPGQPSGNDGAGSAEHYLILRPDGEWNDVNSGNNSQLTVGYTAEAGAPGALYGTIDEDHAFAFSAGALLANDGSGATFQSVSATSAKGAAISYDAASGAITYDPTGAAILQNLGSGATTTDTFTYTFQGSGGPSTATVTLTVAGLADADNPPLSVAESYSTNKGTALTVAAAQGVLANDADAEHDTLTALKVTDPAHGTLTLNSNGSFTYTPTAGYSGPDSFTYQASDGTRLGDVTTVSLTVNATNTPPVLANVATSASYAEHAAPLVLAPALTLTDDGTTLAFATVHIADGTFAGDGDVLAANTAGTSITASYDAATETLTLSGHDTVAHYQQVLRTVTFASSSSTPADHGAYPTRTIEWQVSDGTAAPTPLFQTQTTYATGSSPLFVALADVNGDGVADLSYDRVGVSNVYVALGDGAGTFGAATTYSVGSGTTGLTTADLNHDGHPDIVVSNVSAGTISVLLNNGAGTFTVQPQTTAGSNPQNIVAGDFNRDGKVDLVVTHATSGAATLLLGNGDGTFGTATAIGTVATTGGNQIIAGDFNNDGKLDLAVALLSTSQIQLMLGNGDGTFTAGSAATVLSGPQGLAASDFDHDGDLDLVAANQLTNSIAILKNDGTGHFAVSYLSTGQMSRVTTGDFDGDGNIDIAATGPGGLSLYRGNGDGTFQAPVTFATGTGPIGIAMADLNADGAPDLVVGNGNASTVSILLGTITSRSAAAHTLVSVTETGAAPVAHDDAAAATEAGGMSNGTAGINPSGNVLANDTDPDDATSALVVSAVRTGTEAAGTGTAGVLGAALAGSYGSLTLNADGSYSYAVDNSNADVQALTAGATLADTFTYTVKDPSGLTDTGQLVVTINGANDAPTVTAGASVSYTERGTPVVLDPGLTITDPDTSSPVGGILTVSITGGFQAGDILDAGPGWSYDAIHGVLTIENDSSIGSFQQLGRGITFASASHDPTAGGTDATRTITWRMDDGQGGVSAAVTSTVTVVAVNDAPTGTVTISGAPTQGQTLNASNTLADPDGLGTVSYQWQRDGADLGGATGASYVLTEADVGHTIDVVAKYTDLGGTPEHVASSAVGPIANLNDAPTGTVTISGTPTQGQTLSASNTLADPDGLGAITYQWQRSGVDISGATGTSYLLTQADVGATIDVVAKYTDGHGTAEQVASSPTAAVADVNDAPTFSALVRGGTYTENDPVATSMFWSPTVLISTVESGQNIDQITLTISGIVDGANERVIVDGANLSVNFSYSVVTGNSGITVNIVASGSTANLTLSKSGGLSVAAAQNLIGLFAYYDGSENPTAGNRVMTLTSIRDTGGTANGGHDTTALSASATITVVPVNDPPVVSINAGTNVNEGALRTINGTLLKFTDVDNTDAQITYKITAGPANGALWLDADNNGTHGAGEDLGVGSTFTQADVTAGKLKYTHDGSETLSDGFQFNVSDGAGGNVTGQSFAITINPINDKPIVANPIPDQNVSEDTPWSFQFAANAFTDPDSTLTYTAKLSSGAALPAWLTFSGATRTFSGTPPQDFNGALDIAVTASDGVWTVSDTFRLTVDPVNDAPVLANAIPDQAVNEDTAWSFQLAANAFSDVDSTLSYTATLAGGAPLPGWLTFNGVTRTFSGTPPQDFNGVLDVTVAASDGSLSATDTFRLTVTPVNDPPTGTVTIGGTAAQGQTLTASNTLSDPDGLGAVSYQWQRDGVDISGATNTSYLLTEADVGHGVAVVARYTDGGGTAEQVASNAVGPVANVNDAPTGTVTINGTAVQGQTVTAANTLDDADGLGAITYQWQRDGVDISGATGTSYLLVKADVGHSIDVVAKYVDGHGTAEQVASGAVGPVTNVDDAPTGAVAISGTPTQGQTLSASNTLDDADGLGTITYQWQRDGLDITGATGTSYVLTEADVGHGIDVVAKYVDGHGTAEQVASGAVGPIANLNDAPTGGVTISGTATQGQTLSASNTIDDADGLGAIAYQWQRDGADILGATGASYLLTEDDVGHGIDVVARYVDGHGAVEQVASDAVGPVANLNDAPTGEVTISGAATQGQTLSASNTLHDADGLGPITYQWQRDGADISGAAGASYLLTEADVGHAIDVVAKYVDGHGTPEQVASRAVGPVVNVNDAPTGEVTISGAATQGQTLSASNTLGDADGLGTITYQWQRDGADIAGATGTSYLLTEADVGRAIEVVATYVDGHGTAERVASSAVGPVANVNDAPTGAVTISGTATQGQTLSVSNTLDDADGLGTITYHWQRDGVDIPGATGTSYVLAEADVGHTIDVVGTYLDGHGTAEKVSSNTVGPVANVNDMPTGAVTISGTAAQGGTLSASNTLDDADGLGAITYQWQRDGVDITGATGTSYLLVKADVGHSIDVVAKYVDGHGTAEQVASGAVGPVTNVNDTPTGGVTISGTATQGHTLSASNTLGDADGLGTITYQWQRDGADISGATGTSYLLAEADVGHAIDVVAKYIDGHGTAEQVASNTVGPVANVNDAPTGAVAISGTATQGQTLSASNTLGDPDGLGTIAYQWQRDGADIAGATGASYLLGEADVGHSIDVVAKYVDGHGAAEQVASDTVGPVANVNDAPTGKVTISGTATQGQTLSASNTLGDPDGLGTIAYQWQRDGVDIAGAMAASYLVGEADVGHAIDVVAKYIDGHGTAEQVASSTVGPIANVNDAPTGEVTTSGAATQGQTLSASNTLDDADGLGIITYQWQRDGADISGATGTSYVLAEADVGHSIDVVAKYVDGHGTAEQVASSAVGPVTNVNDAPTGAVTINGNAAQGETLTAANTLDDADGLGTVTYQWQRNGVDIAGATGVSYLLGEIDVGATIDVVASYLDGHGTSEHVTSSATAEVANVNDAPSGKVTISGVPQQGETLTAANTLDDADGLGAISYQWQRGGKDIVGATGTTYTLTADDVGNPIDVVASYVDGHGTHEHVASEATALTASPPLDIAPVNTVPGAQSIEANTAAAITGLSIDDVDAGGGTMTTTLSVAHGTLILAALGGASVAGSGTSSVTINGTLAQINATLGSSNVVYQGNHDYFDADTLTVVTNDNGNTGSGGPLSDTDQVTINLTTHQNGTSGDDSFTALAGNERIDGGLGNDTITFGFRLVDARVSYVGGTTVIDGPGGSHTVLTGFEIFKFTDGTVNNNDGNPLVDDLFYYAQNHDVWTAHVDADQHYNTNGWKEGRNPNPWFDTAGYLAQYRDVAAAGINPLEHYDQFGWREGRDPSPRFDTTDYLSHYLDVAAVNVDPLAHFVTWGFQEARLAFNDGVWG
jgi:VCBS repeat-containing protein